MSDKRPYDQKTCDGIVLERIRAVKRELATIPSELLRHGSDSAVTDLVHLAGFNLDLAERRIVFDTYMDKKRRKRK